MKKVTILLPAYNEEKSFRLMEECMNRVLEENPGYEWEFIVGIGGTRRRCINVISTLIIISIDIIIAVSSRPSAPRFFF